MSFTRKIVDGVTELLDKVSADGQPLSGVDPASLEAELKARVASRKRRGERPADANPRSRWAGSSRTSSARRTRAADVRERHVRSERDQKAKSDRRAQEEAFRRMREQAARDARSQASSGRTSSSGGGRRARPSFGGLGRSDELARAYKVLNLPYGAEFAEVKSAYRKLMRKYHPDLHNQSPQKQKAATELTMKVTQAYNALEEHLQGK